MIYLDTHVVVWLYARGGESLPHALARRIEASDDLRISPMVRLELQYLFEVEKVSEPPLPVLDALGAVLGLRICTAGFPAVVREAEARDWTRDPFDRLIVAQAALFEAPLATRDAMLHAHYPHAVWDEA